MRFTIAVLLFAVSVCAQPAPAPPKVVTNPDYVVFRPVSTESTAGPVQASVDNQTFYFNPAERVLDLREIDADACNVEQSQIGEWVVAGKLTPDGGKKFGAWTEAHINQHLGIFVAGKLISAPVIRSRIEDMFVIEGTFTKAQAEEIVARLRGGGATK